MYEPTDKQINDYYWNRYGTQEEKPTHEQKMMEEYKRIKEKEDN